MFKKERNIKVEPAGYKYRRDHSHSLLWIIYIWISKDEIKFRIQFQVWVWLLWCDLCGGCDPCVCDLWGVTWGVTFIKRNEFWKLPVCRAFWKKRCVLLGWFPQKWGKNHGCSYYFCESSAVEVISCRQALLSYSTWGFVWLGVRDRMGISIN